MDGADKDIYETILALSQYLLKMRDEFLRIYCIIVSISSVFEILPYFCKNILKVFKKFVKMCILKNLHVFLSLLYQVNYF